MNAEGAETADKALKPLTVAEVADTLVLRADVALTVTPNEDVALKSVILEDTEFTVVPLILLPLTLPAELMAADDTV